MCEFQTLSLNLQAIKNNLELVYLERHKGGGGGGRLSEVISSATAGSSNTTFPPFF